MPVKSRIDVLMVERGLSPSRSLAQRLIMAGQVRLDGQLVHKASEMAEADAVIEVISLPKYVSRGGEKLEAAIIAFGVNPMNWVCADVGASTGGFTDCLLQAGAQTVYAIDAGKGQLHWRLRGDKRVVSLEETNVRYLEVLPERMDLVVIDVSFISLSLVFPVIKAWLKPEGICIALIKPQFEAGRGQVGKGGVVKDPLVHAQVIRSVLEAATVSDLYGGGLIQSPLKGPKGNIEFLTLLNQEKPHHDLDELISKLIQ
jgi:23S rRNA (cytidine1920-2'-O)/16S rRNA (cytidine1409-2'-O)-methyltransferase